MLNLKDAITEIKARTDLRALAEEFGLSLKRGSCLCPFHDDHHPSLSIKPHGYFCFSCAAKGDALSFLMNFKQIGFLEAAEILARRAGVDLPGRGMSRKVRTTPKPNCRPIAEVNTSDGAPPVDADLRVTIYTTLAKAALLREGYAPHAGVTAYLRARGISQSTAIAAGVGAVPIYKRAAQALRKNFAISDLQAVQLFNDKGNFRLYKRSLLLPSWADGEAFALQARNIEWRNKEDDGPKELSIGPVAIPFNADVLLEPQSEVYVCEGAVDTLSMLELGFPAIGIPGARNFRPEWCELFDDIGEVILALDNDRAGDEGAAMIAGHFGRYGREVTRLELPSGVKDINEFLTAKAD